MQIDRFHAWLKKQGYPEAEVRVDSANTESWKKIIQGVSGVAGDVMDMWSPGGDMYFYNEVGIIEDLTDAARELGFDVSTTYPALETSLTVEGRQFMYPCNVTTSMYYVNKDTFRKYGMEPPPYRWTFEDFERIGKEFRDRANRGLKRQLHFITEGLDPWLMLRSLGLDPFNETGTEATLDDPRFVRVLELIRKWTYEDRILPSAADRASFSTQSGYGGATLQLFDTGNFAMFKSGRYALIQLRKFGKLSMGLSEPPHGGFPNTDIASRAAAVYVGSQHKQHAKHFLAYLASDDYNETFIDDPDALPPNPKYTEREDFLRPKDYPNEWGLHEGFAKSAITIAIPVTHVPFFSTWEFVREFGGAQDRIMTEPPLSTTEEAVKRAHRRLNEVMQRAISENPGFKKRHDELVVVQRKIDERKARGEKIPRQWIRNPFYLRYYEAQGRLE
jgi:multiple sugar transport system substrate-binding protein